MDYKLISKRGSFNKEVPFSLLAESEQYRDSKDFLTFLKKPKLEIPDQHQVDQDKKPDRSFIRSLERPGGCTLQPSPDKFSNACITSEPKVKVHFLGLKKVSVRGGPHFNK